MIEIKLSGSPDDKNRKTKIKYQGSGNDILFDLYQVNKKLITNVLVNQPIDDKEKLKVLDSFINLLKDDLEKSIIFKKEV